MSLLTLETQTPFYSTMDTYYEGTAMPSVFSARDPTFHKNLKVPVAQLFSMTNMKNYEQYADECTEIFYNAMRDLEGTAVDLAVWLQWYAFDVIACITFQRRFGFLEQRADVGSMMAGIDFVLHYVKIVGQYPGLHPWLVANRTFMKIVTTMFPNLPDPMSSFLQAGGHPDR